MELSVPLGHGTWMRTRADLSPIPLINRYYEDNPENTTEQTGLIERPALVSIINKGPGPGRRLFRQSGFAGGALFQVSGSQLWKHVMAIPSRTITSTQITGTIAGNGAPDFATSRGYMFVTDGVTLQWTDGTTALATVATPGSISFSSIDTFNDYIICVVANSDRFYWIRPEEVIIDPLNFATAERFPDKVQQVRAVGDEFWLLGDKSIEVWRATGDGAAPFQRIEGRAFNFGIFGGTAVRMKDTSVIAVADDGTVFDIRGVPKPISNPGIAEATRNAILASQGG